jgi:hypothetical protein
MGEGPWWDFSPSISLLSRPSYACSWRGGEDVEERVARIGRSQRWEHVRFGAPGKILALSLGWGPERAVPAFERA